MALIRFTLGEIRSAKDLQSRVTLLEAENVLLKSETAKGGVTFH